MHSKKARLAARLAKKQEMLKAAQAAGSAVNDMEAAHLLRLTKEAESRGERFDLSPCSVRTRKLLNRSKASELDAPS